MHDFTIYHNPRCSKSREALDILNNNKIHPKVVLYLEHPLKSNEIKKILKKLNLSPRDLLRKGEPQYNENNLQNESLLDNQILNIMEKFPKLIERPIITRNNTGIIGRPPEKVLELL